MQFRSLTLVLAAALSLSASAEPSFDLVDHLFESGGAFELSSKVGTHVGHCWSSKSETPLKSLLFIDQKFSTPPCSKVTTKFGIYLGHEENASTFDSRFKREWDSISVLSDGHTKAHTMSFGEYAQYLKQSSDGTFLVAKSFHFTRNEALACYFYKQLEN